MKKTLIIKIGATGDVVRTTPILEMLDGEIVWITEKKNLELLEGVAPSLTAVCWEDRNLIRAQEYDLVINLEDSVEVAKFLASLSFERSFGAYLNTAGELSYTSDSSAWFDLSLISKHGRVEADQLKLVNRRAYQDLIFEGLGWKFRGQKYQLPQAIATDLHGDIAVAPKCGPVWPVKNWPHFNEIKDRLEAEGYKVNYLPKRNSLRQHLGDIANHSALISGDSLPMHFALGLGLPCLTLFTCTSPWEIHDYGIQRKLISPRLSDFFYQRKFDKEGVSAISIEDVYRTARKLLEANSL